jgi:RNA-directed DNA polymerase
MSVTPRAHEVSPRLLKVAELARKDLKLRFHTLAHLVDEDTLRRAFDRLKGRAAVGVDGITKETYGQNLEDNLSALRTRMKAGQYRHQPIRRVHIAKAPNQTRPIGISSVEDKIVQGALREVLEAIWRKWLDRRSQRARMNWDRFGLILDRFPLPRPTIRVQIWARAG